MEIIWSIKMRNAFIVEKCICFNVCTFINILLKEKKNRHYMKFFYFLIILLFTVSFSKASEKVNLDEKWKTIISQGSNKVVNFHAWGGSKNINNYINWVSVKVKNKYGINLKHVKIKDTSQAVKKVLYEKLSKKNNDGSIDIIWINGENFSSMLENNLLYYKNWIYELPNSKNIDLRVNSILMYDFGIFNQGKEMPWGLSQLIYFYDSAKILNPPRNAVEFKEYVVRNPGRVTFPQPPDFTGTSFLKQILVEITQDKQKLKEKFNFNKHAYILDGLWSWLDFVTPYLWKQGKSYPKNYVGLAQLLSDDEVDVAMSFNISFPSNEVTKKNLPLTTKSYISTEGSLSNVHYLAIPYNATNPSGSKLVIDYMISPEAQLRKEDHKFWGDPNILSFSKLEQKWKEKFNKLSSGPAMIKKADLEKKIQEPHPSWVKEIEENWIKRYGSIN